MMCRLRHVGRQGEPGTNCDTRHWDANQSIFLLCRLHHVGRQGEPGPNCDTRHWEANPSIFFSEQASTH
ncbi:MAG: hypothetical protein ACK55Z_23895, partial [bacterium]